MHMQNKKMLHSITKLKSSLYIIKAKKFNLATAVQTSFCVNVHSDLQIETIHIYFYGITEGLALKHEACLESKIKV